MAATADWSLLPSELVRRIADCLLDTNDLDCYMDFRGVCLNWRFATDDPKNSSELRFRPCRWIIIDEVFQSDSHLLVNTASGRVVRKELPVLRDYYVVATTHGGFFVLADKEPPHAAVVLNPFTGYIIRYNAAVPFYVEVFAAALSGLVTGKLLKSSAVSELRSSPTLVLLWDEFYEQHMAVPDSDGFTQEVNEQDVSSFMLQRLAVASGICATGDWIRRAEPVPASLVHKISYLMRLFAIDPYKVFSDKLVTRIADLHNPRRFDENHFYLVESAGELLAIIKMRQHLKVFSLDNLTDSDVVEPVKSIGDRAIFIGHRMCFSVTASKFPSLVANCVYYVGLTLDIYKYDIKTGEEERVSQATYPLKSTAVSFPNPPFTIVHLLSSYTVNVRESQLAAKKLMLHLFPRAIPFLDCCSSDSDLEY